MGATDIIPTVLLHTETQLPENTNCLACSKDGQYLCLGHGQGLSVWCASTLVLFVEWLQDRLEITSVQMIRIAEFTYLLGTVDDMGVARILAQHYDFIYLISVINVMEDINKRSICLAFELIEEGQYGVASVSCSGAAWLEVYHLPSAQWLRELEMAQTQQQDSKTSGDLKWSPVTMVIKIKPPNSPAEILVDCELDISQTSDQTSDFLKHCLTLDVIQSSSQQWENQFLNTDAEKMREENKCPRLCTQHFLLPCGQLSGGDKAALQTGSPVAVAVWWSGSKNLLHYLLKKTPKTKADVEALPDVLWSNAKEILCSAVSRSTRYIALGLSDALVCVFDRLSVELNSMEESERIHHHLRVLKVQTAVWRQQRSFRGAPLSVVLEPASSGAFFRMQFMDSWPLSADESQIFTAEKVQLLVLCKTGAIHTVTTGRGAQSCTMQRSKDPWDVPITMISVPFMQGLLLIVQMNGNIFLQDVINNRTVCLLTPSTSHLITTPCNPVYALNTEQQTLFIRGDQENCGSPLLNGSHSQLLSFRFKGSDIIKQYEDQLLHSPPLKHTAPSHVMLEETCNHYLEQRVHSVDERNKSVDQTWKKLQETAVTLQQRQQSSRHLKN